MRFPAMNSQRRQKVSIPKLNGGVNYRDAMNLVEDNQLTDVKNMWFKDGALRTRYGLTLYKGEEHERPFEWFSDTGDIVSHCFCKSSGITYLIERKKDTSYNSIVLYVFDFFGRVISAKKEIGKTDDAFLVPYNQIYNGIEYDAILYCNGINNMGEYSLLVYGLRGAGLMEELTPYAPTILVGGTGDKYVSRDPNITGNYMLEGYNILTDEYIAYYNTDAESTKYYLPTPSKEGVVIEYTSVDGTYIWSGEVGDTSVQADKISTTATITEKYIEFSAPLSAVEGKSNNLKITAHSDVAGKDADVFAKMTTYAWFGGNSSGSRLFVSGGGYRGNRVYYSSLNNPLYFSENNYIDIGSTNGYVTSFGKQADMLVIFKNDETHFATYVAGEALKAEDIMGNVPAVDIETLRATFPVTQLSGNIGCDLPSTIRNMQNRLMWADSYGRVWTLIYSNEYSTRNIRAIGGLISRKLKDSNINLDGAIAVNYDNYYMLIAYDVKKQTNVAFVLDTEDYGYAYYTSYGSDKKAQNSMGWYAWELPQMDILFSHERAGAPLIFAKDGERLIAYTMADGSDEKVEADGTITQTTIPCMFQTKLFDMRQPERDKSFDRVYISVGKSQELCAEAVYVTDKGNFIDSAKIACEGISDAFTAQFIDNKTLSPNIRAKRFALRMENNGTMYIDGISIYYR